MHLRPRQPGSPLSAPTRWDAARPRGGVVLLADEAPPSVVTRLVEGGFDVVWLAVAGKGDFAVLAEASRAKDQLDAGRPRFVVGVGAGGLQARMLACTARGLAGAVSFQGAIAHATLTPERPAQPMDLLPGLDCPLLCHFAARDEQVSRAQVQRLRERLRDCRPTALVYTYEDASPEAFLGGMGDVDAAAHTLAWARTLAFLSHLVAAAG